MLELCIETPEWQREVCTDDATTNDAGRTKYGCVGSLVDKSNGPKKWVKWENNTPQNGPRSNPPPQKKHTYTESRKRGRFVECVHPHPLSVVYSPSHERTLLSPYLQYHNVSLTPFFLAQLSQPQWCLYNRYMVNKSYKSKMVGNLDEWTLDCWTI